MPSSPAASKEEPAAASAEGHSGAAKAGMLGLTLGALGVVFGDIGTSPLYALQTVFAADGHAVHANPGDVYGVISLVFWSITMIVSVKYVTFIMRADNGGEGGIMALTALIDGMSLKSKRAKLTLITLGILGAALFYGDGMITPAISVLSAVEGLKTAAPSLGSLVLPITVTIITLLFAIQRFGTQHVGDFFGPVMAVWFGVLGLLGVRQIVTHPSVIRGLSPTYGAQFFFDHPAVAFIALGSVVLAITGAEALYADMGHFGRSPIRRAWFWMVFPALSLNYLAQGSLILHSPRDVRDPFFLLAPSWAQVPMVALATIATVIASQSVISGAFSVTRQAVQLGFLPRIRIRQTSQHEVGQVYAPAINFSLFVAVVTLVLAFGSSAALASAYGVAVTGTFILNTVLFLAVARLLWHKSKRLIALGAVVFLSIEITFFAANLTKIVHGGWLPLVIAAIIFTVLVTWRKGADIVGANRRREEGQLREFVSQIEAHDFHVVRVPGTAVFLSADPQTTPLALRANVEHNHVLHEDVVILSIEIERVPHIADSERILADDLGNPHDQITSIKARFGFQDDIDVPATLRLADHLGLIEDGCDLQDVSYFVSQITIVRSEDPRMRPWRKRLFLRLAENAVDSVEYFGLPDNQTLMIGERIEL